MYMYLRNVSCFCQLFLSWHVNQMFSTPRVISPKISAHFQQVLFAQNCQQLFKVRRSCKYNFHRIRLLVEMDCFFHCINPLFSSDNSKAKFLAQYLAELTLLDAEKYLNFAPSLIGAASVALSRHTLGLAAWDSAMSEKTGYQISDFQVHILLGVN